MKLTELAEDFILHTEVNTSSARTSYNYRWRLKYFLERYGDTSSKKLKKVHLQKLILDLRNAGKLTETSVNAVVQGIKAFCAWMLVEGYLKEPIHEAISRKTPKERPKARPITAEAAQIMLSRCQTKRDRALLIILCDTGARRGEVVSLQIKNINFEKRVALVTGKVGERLITFTARTVAAVLDYIQSERPEVDHDYLFCNYRPPHGRIIGQTIYELCTKLGEGLDAPVNPHAFRHWVCNEYAHNGGLDVAQHKMGHKSITTTMNYVHTDIRYVQEKDQELSVLNYLE